MLNSDTTKLDQILTMGQSSKTRLGYIGITNNEATTPKTVFVKVGVRSDVATSSKIVSTKAIVKIVNTLGSGKNSTPSLSEGKKRFIPICHYCNRSGHIQPKCFEYKNIFKMGRFCKYNYNPRVSVYKSRIVSKHKIYLKDNFVKNIWVKKNQI